MSAMSASSTSFAPSAPTGSPHARLTLGDPEALAYAADRLAAGDAVAHGFGNFYAITARPEREVVEGINALKGRPLTQVGSVLTTPFRAARLFDWSQLPDGLTPARVFDLMDRLFALGPFGFRGPAAAHVPDHLTSFDGDARTTQLIAPGARCPSIAFLARAMERTGSELLYVTSANRSRHQTGAEDEPAHFRADAIAREFAGAQRFLVLAHEDDDEARRAHPLHDPMSTTILAFHRLEAPVEGGRPRLFVERHGSLPLTALAPIAADLGFDLALGPKAVRRLALRRYDDEPVR
jgi:tRNA A37 threonylcarbamoyladenosine synthetase subunit TsaC/SUA5/YrdC